MRTRIETHCDKCGSLIQRLTGGARIVARPDGIVWNYICRGCRQEGETLLALHPKVIDDVPPKKKTKKDDYKAKVPVDNRIKRRRVSCPQDGSERTVSDAK